MIEFLKLSYRALAMLAPDARSDYESMKNACKGEIDTCQNPQRIVAGADLRQTGAVGIHPDEPFYTPCAGEYVAEPSPYVRHCIAWPRQAGKEEEDNRRDDPEDENRLALRHDALDAEAQEDACEHHRHEQ